MKRLQPVIWSKGTFLSPQHLQTQDRYIESVLQFQLEGLAFAPSGFKTLMVNQEALAAGHFGLVKASGIFPDGLLFDMPDSDPLPPPKPLSDCFEADQAMLDMYLAVPHFRERGINVSMAQSGVDSRYLMQTSLFRDENSGDSEKPVQMARKNFRFLTEDESRQESSALKIARIRKTTAGTFQLDSRFVAPSLDVASSDFLVAILRRLVELLAAKSSQLSGSRRQKNLSLADFGSADIANFWLLYTINSRFAILQHILETRGGHPEHLYAELLGLAGSLTTFSGTIHPRDLPRYDHENLAECFGTLDEKLRLLLETVVPTNFVSLKLKLVQPSIHATSLSDDKYFKDTRMYLAVNANMNEAELIGKAPYLLKVCSATHIDHLVTQALPGVTLTHTPRPPAEIPVKLNYQYFSLNQSGVAWEAVTRARNLAAYVPGDFPAPQLELLVLLPGTQ
jgi:type VI secretion system protein ImpJ